MSRPNSPSSIAAAVARKIGVDRAVFWTIFTQCARLITGPVTMLLMVHALTPEMQGYAYAFGGVVALGVFLEMGFSQNILQFAAHEFAKLETDEFNRISGDPEALSRLVSLGRLSFKYYWIAATILLIGLLVGGTLFFKSVPNTSSVAWEAPWIMASVGAVLSVALNPFWALLEGCNKVAELERFRFSISLFGFAVTCVALLGGLGLYALVLPNVITFFISIGWIMVKWRRFFSRFRQLPTAGVVSWRGEIWPFQWRIAVSWMCGYFIFSMVTPVVFKLAGPVEAGKLGFTLQLVRMVATIACSWSVAKLPLYGMLAARQEWDEMVAIWKRCTSRTIFASVVGSIAMLIAMEFAPHFYAKLGERYSGTTIASILCLGMVIQTLTTCFAYYLRAFKSEPYMRLSILNAVLSAALIPVGTQLWGATGAAIGYSLAIAITVFPGFAIFKRKRVHFR